MCLFEELPLTVCAFVDSYNAAEPLEFPDVYQEGVRLLENYSCNFEARDETEKEAFFRKLSWDEKVKVVVVGARSCWFPYGATPRW